MQGICSKHPGELAEALAPIAGRCEQLDWAVDLYSGPLRFPYYVDEEPGNVVAYHHAEAGRVQSMHWFDRGFLPRHADCLIMDEWSSYLGFDSRAVSAAELAERLATDLSPRPLLFDVVTRATCCTCSASTWGGGRPTRRTRNSSSDCVAAGVGRTSARTGGTAGRPNTRSMTRPRHNPAGFPPVESTLAGAGRSLNVGPLAVAGVRRHAPWDT